MTKDIVTLTVQKRTSMGKGFNRRLRAAGVIPAVFYTAGGESTPVQVAEAPLMKIFETMGRTTVFNVAIEDGDTKTVAPALLWDIDFHPTKTRLLHVDFYGVDLNKEVKIRIPLEFRGVAKGAKLGGILETFVESLDVVGKPLDIPNKLVVDVTPLDLGAMLRIGDLPLPEGVRAASNTASPVLLVKDKSASGKEEGEEGGASK